MKRRVIIAVSIMGVILVTLTVALASVGTHFDQTRIDRDELKLQVDSLQEEIDNLSGERDQLKAQVDDQLKTIEQLKAELERARSQAAAPAPASPATTP